MVAIGQIIIVTVGRHVFNGTASVLVFAEAARLVRLRVSRTPIMCDKLQELQTVADKLGIGNYCRHVFLCTGPTCCTPETGMAAWEALKKALKDKGLLAGPNACYRTKVGCLRICTDGPTMVVYPEGTWYHGMTPERIEQFVQQHLIDGKPIEDWVFARNALTTKGATGA
jgi:(2Fe-2S) ferredoxin